jgi:hypothetical protein
MSWLKDLAQSTCDPKQGCDVWAYAHNYLFESRLSDARRKKYEAHCAARQVPTGSSWIEAHAGHVQNTIKVSRPFVAETFRDINEEAQTDLGDDLVILRCEDLTRALAHHGCSLNQLQDWLAVRDGQQRKHITTAQARSKLRDFLADWNQQRKLWPAFAAFEHELGEARQLARTDWPHELRNRLGMAHYDGKLSVPVALMRVPAQEIKASARALGMAAFARPTVLDGEMNRYYYPSPAEFPFGATLHLDPLLCGQRMTAEILCLPLDYKVEHLIAVASLSLPPPGHCLRNLRNSHLLGLRREPGGDVFGDLIEAHDCQGGTPCR